MEGSYFCPSAGANIRRSSGVSFDGSQIQPGEGGGGGW